MFSSQNLKHVILGSLLVGAVFATEDVQAQRKKKKEAEAPAAQQAKPAASKNGIKPYSEVITAKANTKDGLFKVHEIDGKYFYEIADSLIGREMLIVTTIAKTAEGIGYGGERTNTQMVRWDRGNGNRINLKMVSYRNTAADSLPIYQAVKNSNLEPIIHSFDIKAKSEDGDGVVIEATDLFSKDVQALGLPKNRRESYKVTRLDNDRSYIEHIHTYPINIESRYIMTYLANNPPSNASTGSITVEMNSSMLLLPKEPMKQRLADRRVGWFNTSVTDYGLDEQKATRRTYLDRWRLEVKDEDIEKFKAGELVEPKKPIVYYIDPATPDKWRPYLKQGVEDWNRAFEAAGFKNAIQAKDAPTPEEDPGWSPEDARYSVIRYFASDIQNAYGPHVSDPRSGEILESDIGWYHNVMNLLRNWYFIQTAAVNPDARNVKFKDDVMGRLIRFVSAHEVGHTLGLPHNFASSNAIPVDSLRSAEFTQKYGTAPSIMDYARFNYVAQPEDKGVSLFPDVGVYDKYAISWGYRPILEAETPEDEQPILNEWITSKNGDPLYRYGRQGNSYDPSAQSEDLGDNAMLASDYGIKNLKRIMPNLIEWTFEEDKPFKDYSDLNEMYGQVIGQFNRYMGHVKTNVGGVYERYRSTGDGEGVYTHTDKATQKEAVKFLNKELFNTPSWLIDNEITARTADFGALEKIRSIQVGTLNSILDHGRLGRVIENEAINGSNAYNMVELFDDLRGGIWTELSNGAQIDVYKRALQRAHLERLQELMTKDEPNVPANFRRFVGPQINASQSDIRPIVRGELKTLQRQVKAAIPRTSDRVSKLHLEDTLERINDILNPKA
ncbi:zinc-dependent metalloprotease [Litoribacter ruber]|uniref:Zinc-dependent metalloprotease n=1 Tax=Litoribacter ruber TaxID=702568 RepID=A0AAP2G3G1_9BACT|nr:MULTISPECIES: zinc-dependent metalloprotease [Litoribacter]MBS9523430.1 zinc-dependent metalloprotease [Litoribacter alkaliphilus]MBT0812444.1 zinc-dependent metalloprotease [Litoribacter ruber]